MAVFDRYTWKPRLFKTSEELENALNTLAVRGKRIRAVHPIGMAKNMEHWAYTQQVRKTLAAAGVSWQSLENGTYPCLDQTLLPCEVQVCEPVVLVFDDGSTLEVKPYRQQGLLLAVDQIDPTVVDGLNHSNFDADVLFARVYGSALCGTEIIRRTVRSCYRGEVEERSRRVTWHFALDGECGLFFRQGLDDWFTFGITMQKHLSGAEYETEKIDYASLRRAARQTDQIPIVEGHDGGDYFWIMPVRPVERSEKYWNGLQEHRVQEISVEEDFIGTFLACFLDKYFDAGNQRDGLTEFDWYGSNLYSYDTVRRMLDEIEHCAALLESDYDSPELNDLKEYFHDWGFRPGGNADQNTAEQARSFRKHIAGAADFYARFVRRMRAMMRAAPECEYIVFEGP